MMRGRATMVLVAALLVASDRTPAQQQQVSTFRAGTAVVSVDVIVRDNNGNIVRGLTADDFIVTEDGKPQRVVAVQDFGPERDYQQHGRVPQITGQKAQHVPGGLVGPVHILDDQDHRLLLGECLQQREHQLKQPRAGGFRIGRSGRGAEPGQQRSKLTSTLAGQ